MVNDLRTLNKQINDVVNYIVKTCCEETSTGNWVINYNDVSDLINAEDFDHFYSVIEEELRGRAEVLDVEPDYDGLFDINVALDYCPNYEWCPGDEEIFGSYEEFEKREIKPVSQPISLTEQADKAERSSTLLYNSISLLCDKTFEDYDNDKEWAEMIYEELGTSKEELEFMDIVLGVDADEPEIIGSITYHYNNETVEYTAKYQLLADFEEALDVHGPNGVSAKVYADDDMLKYLLDAAIYNVYGEDILCFEEWETQKQNSNFNQSLDSLVSSAEKRNSEQQKEQKNAPCNEYYIKSDGWFDYYENKETGEKKLKLDKNDVCIVPELDDFSR